MNRRIVLSLVLAVGGLCGRAAEERFSHAIRAEDFAAAGLGKLSAEEIARLDTLVGAFKRGVAPAAGRAEIAGAGTPTGKAGEGARRAPAKSGKVAAPSAPAAAAKPVSSATPAETRVTLAPGTQIDYSTVETRIAGEFRGWEGRTIFTLENGQRWQAAGTDPYVSPPVQSPAVKIAPGLLGTFWMTVEGVRPRVKVVYVGPAR